MTDPRFNAEIGPHFMGIPDRWFENATWRCENGHISKIFLKTEKLGDICLICLNHVHLTFPEDCEEK